MEIYFSDVFDIPSDDLEDYGAFNVPLVNDLPLFIDGYANLKLTPTKTKG